MKHFISIAILLGILCAGCATRESVISNMTANQVVYQVFGMDCPGCHGGLEKNIEKIPGVVKAKANWKLKIVTINLEPGQTLDESALKKAVENSNFTLGKRVN